MSCHLAHGRHTTVKVARAVSLVLITASLFSCSPAPPIPAPPLATPAPEKLPTLPAPLLTRVEGFADHLELTWRTFRIANDLIAGYDVYVAVSPGISKLPTGDPALNACLFGGAAYPGDTDGIIDSESINITPATMGTRYYVHVRTVFPDGRQTPPSDEREVIARPKGTLTLRPRFSGTNDGFSFPANRSVSSLSDSNDVYLFVSKEGFCLGSPSRLDPSLHRTAFRAMGPSASIDDFPECPRDMVGTDKIALQFGYTVALITGDGHMAKLRPQEIPTRGDTTSVSLDYIYQPITGEPRF